jgi:anti-sigma regulatory factor (Ser/Thr protein kinase)
MGEVCVGTDFHHHDSCLLEPSKSAPARARRFVSSTLATWGVAGDYADVPLVTSELVTNAVRHAEGDVGVSLDLNPDRVRLEVSDLSQRLPVMRARDSAHIGGWGMHIIDRLASRWGLEPRAGGKTVWCEVEHPAA